MKYDERRNSRKFGLNKKLADETRQDEAPDEHKTRADAEAKAKAPASSSQKESVDDEAEQLRTAHSAMDKKEEKFANRFKAAPSDKKDGESSIFGGDPKKKPTHGLEDW